MNERDFWRLLSYTLDSDRAHRVYALAAVVIIVAVAALMGH